MQSKSLFISEAFNFGHLDIPKVENSLAQKSRICLPASSQVAFGMKIYI